MRPDHYDNLIIKHSGYTPVETPADLLLLLEEGYMIMCQYFSQTRYQGEIDEVTHYYTLKPGGIVEIITHDMPHAVQRGQATSTRTTQHIAINDLGTCFEKELNDADQIIGVPIRD